MSLASNLNTTATRLINKYGNVYTVVKNSGGVYDPQTGTVANTSTPYSKYGSPSPIGKEEYNRFPEVMGNASLMITFSYDSDFDGIDNKWTIDGRAVFKVVETVAQDTKIYLRVFVK